MPKVIESPSGNTLHGSPLVGQGLYAAAPPAPLPAAPWRPAAPPRPPLPANPPPAPRAPAAPPAPVAPVEPPAPESRRRRGRRCRCRSSRRCPVARRSLPDRPFRGVHPSPAARRCCCCHPSRSCRRSPSCHRCRSRRQRTRSRRTRRPSPSPSKIEQSGVASWGLRAHRRWGCERTWINWIDGRGPAVFATNERRSRQTAGRRPGPAIARGARVGVFSTDRCLVDASFRQLWRSWSSWPPRRRAPMTSSSRWTIGRTRPCRAVRTRRSSGPRSCTTSGTTLPRAGAPPPDCPGDPGRRAVAGAGRMARRERPVGRGARVPVAKRQLRPDGPGDGAGDGDSDPVAGPGQVGRGRTGGGRRATGRAAPAPAAAAASADCHRRADRAARALGRRGGWRVDHRTMWAAPPR